MKQVALGRNNWMFIGSIDAGNLDADLMALISSAVRNDRDIFVYVKDVLDRLLAGGREYAALRPDIWQFAHPGAVRVYHEDERRHRTELKSVKRERRRTGRRQVA